MAALPVRHDRSPRRYRRSPTSRARTSGSHAAAAAAAPFTRRGSGPPRSPQYRWLPLSVSPAPDPALEGVSSPTRDRAAPPYQTCAVHALLGGRGDLGRRTAPGTRAATRHRLGRERGTRGTRGDRELGNLRHPQA